MAVSGFGYTGPYRSRGALDMIVQGMSGLMSLTGEPDGPAMRCGTSASDVFTGLYAFGAISAALYDREKTGKGQFIDVAMLDATFSCLENAVINTCVFGTDPQRVGNSPGRGGLRRGAHRKQLHRGHCSDDLTRPPP